MHIHAVYEYHKNLIRNVHSLSIDVWLRFFIDDSHTFNTIKKLTSMSNFLLHDSTGSPKPKQKLNRVIPLIAAGFLFASIASENHVNHGKYFGIIFNIVIKFEETKLYNGVNKILLCVKQESLLKTSYESEELYRMCAIQNDFHILIMLSVRRFHSQFTSTRQQIAIWNQICLFV